MHRTGYALTAIAATLAGSALAAPQVATTGGRIAGVAERGVSVFRGIPYAAAPTGANRWRSPRPMPRWSDVRPATAFGHNCWQAVSPTGFGPWTHEYVVPGDISEDCLFLNVWTPAPAAARPRAVLVWIHGGGFNSGSGSLPIYDGAALARRGIVVVTVNYRVGPFGFLAHPELTAEAAGGPTANYGLQDLLAALRWVQANAAAFGGDPARVTIAGQSAGSIAVGELVASPLARGLFSRAIVESGLPRPLAQRTRAEAQGVAFAAEKGATSLAALRALPAEALQASSGANAVRFAPVADGVLLPSARWQAASDVPMLVGFTQDEGSALGKNYGSADPAELKTLLAENFGASADRLAPLYPAATAVARSAANRQVRRDRAMGGIDDWFARRGATARRPVFAYRFTHVMPGPEAARWGAFHSSEIPYVFETLAASPERAFTAADRSLSQRMASYWVNFVEGGDPNGRGLPAWPAFDAGAPRVLAIGDTIRPEPLLPPDKLAAMRAFFGTTD